MQNADIAVMFDAFVIAGTFATTLGTAFLIERMCLAIVLWGITRRK